MTALARTLTELAACRLCRDAPRFPPALPHEPRPVIQADTRARILIAGQAPGVRVHASGRPFTDPSGVRLRQWLGLDEAAFYDPALIAIVPMGHCFPGLDAKGADLPPRRECAPHWRPRVLAGLPHLELALLIGQYAQRWHLSPPERAGGLTETVSRWRAIHATPRRTRLVPLPHPSWRNNAWLRNNPWFEADLLPALRAEIARLRNPAEKV